MEDKKHIATNIYDFKDLNCEIIKLINRAYRKGLENGREAALAELEDDSGKIHDPREMKTICDSCDYNEKQYCVYFDRPNYDPTYGCTGYKNSDKPKYNQEEDHVVSRCEGCIFKSCKEDHVRCRYYNIPLGEYSVVKGICRNRVSFHDCRKVRVKPNEYLTMIAAFNYFKMDGGCDMCGSQRCTADAKMILEGHYCDAFKKYLSEG